ncbi:hypothetical protein KVR01_012061 [Diaporthe batatas]|uniref:uncharacterized protein n=1 Tax=Diaporthe batatas TaxID=748121 RepID=UPI001D03F6F7|nr:uncharacterized protein KVR01_012061 [Diaporthe batatas]KAG8158300.1 hypothetical protein KVR01_012061 [Diaporthe batatas]
MAYYSEGETRRPRWKFWRSKSGDISHSDQATKQSSSRSDDSYRERPPKRSDDPTLENATLPGQLATTTNSSDASSELKESTASPSLNPRTLSNSSIAPVEHTKSTATSTSSPVVTRETHTDPVTGDLIITMTTTIVTTTTTKRIIKIPPATRDEVDLDEERRLAAEYLASNGMQSPRDRHPGLQPAPRRSGSHSNLVSRSSEQSSFGPRPHASDRSYSMGSRTGPPPSFHNHARNFSRPGPKQACEEGQTRLSLDARRGLKRAETMRSKSLILRKPEPKPPAISLPTPKDADPQQYYSHSIGTIAFQNTHARPHTRDGGERWTGSQRQPTFHKPRIPHPASPRAEEADPSPRRGSWATFGGEETMKHQRRQQATNNFILGIPSTGGDLGNMF